MKKLKVYFCTDGIFPHSVGGMQRHSRLLAEHLAQSNELELIVIHPHPQQLFAQWPSVKEVMIAPIDPHKNYLLECYRYSERVYEIIKNDPGSVVYSQGLSVWKNIKKIRQPLIVNPHGLEPYQAISFKEKLAGIPFKIIFNYIFRNADYVVSLGGRLTPILESKVKNSRTEVIILPNGVNAPAAGNAPETAGKTKIRLLFVARFAHNKGIQVLLQAIKELNAEGWSDKLTFDLGGKGPLFEYYRTNYNYNNVHYLGFISDEELTALYKNSDLFVFPTLFEGMPTVVLEAMSFGLPVIVSDVGATAELVDETNGYLIEKNNVAALKKAITDFYGLDEAQKIMRSKASLQRVISTYNWEVISRKYIETFKRAASGVAAK